MLLRKMFRDIKNNLGPFISIFLMTILASFVFSGINAEWYGMQTEADRFYEESKLPDLWIMGNKFDKEDLKRVKQMTSVSEASLRLSAHAITGKDNNKTLTINIIEDTTLSNMLIVEGKAFSSDEDGLWLDKYFAEANELSVGHTIFFEIAGLKLERTISGLILHPEYILSSEDGANMPDFEKYGFAFMHSSSFPQGFEIPYNQILISIKENNDEAVVYKELEYMFSDRYFMIIDRNAHQSVSAFRNEIEQNKAVGGVFPIVFFLIAALSLLTTMTRLTNSQRTQIGILKALGFSKNRILLHYISYGLWIGLMGSIIGLLTGPLLLSPILFDMQKTLYILPEWYAVISKESFIVAALLTISCGLSSYIACHKQLKDVPATCLRPKAPKKIGRCGIEKCIIWKKMSFAVQWNLRDVTRSRVRSLVVLIGIAGCTALILFAFGLRNTMNSAGSWMYGDLNVYENRINLTENPSDEDLSILDNSFNGQWVQESAIELKSSGTARQGLLTVLDEGTEIRFEDEKRNNLILPKDAVGISYKMADVLGVNIGDTIEWRIYGDRDWNKSKIALIYRTPVGQGISMRRAYYESNYSAFKPTALLTSEVIPEGLKSDAVKNIQNTDTLMNNFNTTLESIKTLIVILILAALVLGGVVLYNLGVLSFSERTRELATMKVLGFFPKQIRLLTQMQNTWLTILGILLGIPAGFLLVSYMFSTMHDTLDLMPYISTISVIISILVTLILSELINLVLSGKIKDIDMVSSLKSVE